MKDWVVSQLAYILASELNSNGSLKQFFEMHNKTECIKTKDMSFHSPQMIHPTNANNNSTNHAEANVHEYVPKFSSHNNLFISKVRQTKLNSIQLVYSYTLVSQSRWLHKGLMAIITVIQYHPHHLMHLSIQYLLLSWIDCIWFTWTGIGSGNRDVSHNMKAHWTTCNSQLLRPWRKCAHLGMTGPGTYQLMSIHLVHIYTVPNGTT